MRCWRGAEPDVDGRMRILLLDLLQLGKRDEDLQVPDVVLLHHLDGDRVLGEPRQRQRRHLGRRRRRSRRPQILARIVALEMSPAGKCRNLNVWVRIRASVGR